MASTFSPNIQLEEPARGDQVGVWDTPVNNNATLIDLVAGAINTISLNNSPVVLAAAQFQSKQITFNSTLTGSVTITFPSTFKKSYEIQNLCTGSSAFVITLGTTVAGGQQICCPPGEIIDCVNDGTNIKFKNLGRVGEYWDYGGSSVPAWVSGCTIPPYALCNGTAISSLHTILPIILGSSLLPDARGRSRFALDQGAGRISSAATGFSGSSVGSGGGTQATSLSSQNIPPVLITDPGHSHFLNATDASIFQGSGGALNVPRLHVGTDNLVTTTTVVTGISAGNASPAAFTNLPPSYIGGIVMIRAA